MGKAGLLWSKTAQNINVKMISYVIPLHMNNQTVGIVGMDIEHDFGDMLIIDCCKIICRTFKKSPVYRIGGDEFAVILENSDYECYGKFLEDFEKIIKEHNQTSGSDSRVSIARGIALYNYETDLVFGNVFKRADDAMYQNKEDMKKREALTASLELPAEESAKAAESASEGGIYTGNRRDKI